MFLKEGLSDMDQEGLQLTNHLAMTLKSDPPASTSLVQGLQVCAIMPVYAVPRMEPRALCLSGKHSAN